MIGRVSRNVVVVSALALVALAAGCFEDKETLTVYPNGSGRIHIWRRLGEDLTETQIQGAGDAAAQRDMVRRGFDAILNSCQGIAAWTDVSAKLDGKRIVEEATGYFDDVTKVKVASPLGDAPAGPLFTWKKNADGGYTFTWSAQDMGAADTIDKPQSDEDKKNEQGVLKSAQTLFMERMVVLPGPITDAKGATVKNRAASVSADGKDFVAFAKVVDTDREQVLSKKLKKDAALADLKAKGKKLGMGLDVTCGPATDDGSEFAKKLAAVKAAYKGSALEKEIKAGGSQ